MGKLLLIFTNSTTCDATQAWLFFGFGRRTIRFKKGGENKFSFSFHLKDSTLKLMGDKNSTFHIIYLFVQGTSPPRHHQMTGRLLLL